MAFNIDLATVSVTLGIFTTIALGAVWVVGLFSRLSVRLYSTEKEITELKHDLNALDERTFSDQKDNEAFRHKYKTSVENLFELIKLRFDDWDKTLTSFKTLMDAKIDLAISKNENKKRNEKN